MTFRTFAPAVLLASTCLAAPAFAADAENPIIVTGKVANETIAQAPSTRARIDAAKIAETVNAVSVEDTLKYLPSLVIRKRHIGDNFAPIATRTSGLGASARSLIYADGALLSALIANNNGNGSPRWTLVTPGEIASVDVLYGPFSAAYSGNSIGTVVEITTRMPEKLEARAGVLANVQDYALYGTRRTLPTWQGSASVGDRFGGLAVLLSVTRTEANGQPVVIVTSGAQPAGTAGGFADVSRTGAPIRVLGAGGIENHVQTTYKAKLAYELSPAVKLAYTLGVWTDDTRGDAESYLQTGTGALTYATANSGATTGFNSTVYTRDAVHLSHALSLAGEGERLDWQVIGTLYDYAKDRQANPSPDAATATSRTTGFVATRNDLPGALAGGAGVVVRQDGTGWVTLDAKAAWRPGAGHVVSFGVHGDRETLSAETWSIGNWRDADAALGQLRTRSYGQTRTLAAWAQDAITLAPALSVTLGLRQEWWRAWGGVNRTLTAALDATIVQPERRFSGASPKASIEWRPGGGWSARLSAGQAWRMPTVGELYQATANGAQFFNPNPNLRPERARSLELAVEKRGARGALRLSLFNEVVKDALISQTATVTQPDGTLFATTFVQNVAQTRARGVEAVVERRDLLPGWDLSASVTYADAITSRNPVFPASVGKLLPSVPRWKGNAVLTWRPTRQISLTGAVRFTSRNFGTLDNSDLVGQTYQGFYKYLVADLRAQFRPTENFTFALGVDNVNNDKYFLFHPFPQRSFTASVDWKL